VQQPNDETLLRSYLARPPVEQADANSQLISYYALRIAVGVIGIALPFVVAIGKLLIEGRGLQGSVSGYYYTIMRDVFVGSLCAIAVFLFTYRGYDWRDNLAGNIAGAAALGVAIFPTTPDPDPTAAQQLIGWLHLLFAAVFFATLAVFCLVLFTKMNPALPPTPEKLKRNLVYRVCGSIIIGCLVLIAGVGMLDAGPALEAFAPVFWLEALAIVAFGVSWLTKGEAILADK
jgi:hypothetical protein